jgi:hypothetical protein
MKGKIFNTPRGKKPEGKFEDNPLVWKIDFEVVK